MYLYMASKKKKQKKQTNNAIPENWIIKKNIKQNEIHKYYSNHDNIGDLTNRRIFIDNYLKEQEHQQKFQLIRSPKDKAMLVRFDAMITHSQQNLKYNTKFQNAGRHYINSLKQKSFDALLQNVAQSNKQYQLEEKTPDLINQIKIMTQPQPQQKEVNSPWSFKNIISNFIGSVD